MTAQPSSERASILVVEDNYLVAREVCDTVRDCGFAVAGPIAWLEAGMSFLNDHKVDGALVDIDLHGREAYPICAELRRLNVPFVFMTGYSTAMIPKAFSDVPVLGKPLALRDIKSALTSFTTRRYRTAPAGRAGNLLLDGLDVPEWEVLAPALETADFAAGDVLEDDQTGKGFVWFPRSGMISAVACIAGHRADVALVGREGMVGLTSVLEARSPPYSSIARFPGDAVRLPATLLRRLLIESPALREQIVRYGHALLAQLAFNNLAAGRARVRERIARWLLMAADRVQSDQLALTHRDLAAALGVRRPGITVALHELEGEGTIRATPRKLRIIDRRKLSDSAGGFYGAAEDYYRRLWSDPKIADPDNT